MGGEKSGGLQIATCPDVRVFIFGWELVSCVSSLGWLFFSVRCCRVAGRWVEGETRRGKERATDDDALRFMSAWLLLLTLAPRPTRLVSLFFFHLLGSQSRSWSRATQPGPEPAGRRVRLIDFYWTRTLCLSSASVIGRYKHVNHGTQARNSGRVAAWEGALILGHDATRRMMCWRIHAATEPLITTE